MSRPSREQPGARPTERCAPARSRSRSGGARTGEGGAQSTSCASPGAGATEHRSPHAPLRRNVVLLRTNLYGYYDR